MSRMASFIAGLGGGYLKADRQRSEDERQAKKDAQDTQLFDVKMEEVARENKLNSDISAAAKPATFSESAPTLDTGDGAKVYDMENGADIASSDARQFQRMAPAAAAPVQGQAFAVNGAAVADKAAMQAAVKAYDDGANDRVAQAYRSNGKPLEALSMSNAVMENKAKSMGLETAELKHLNTLYNNKVISRLKAPGGTMFENAAQIVSDVQFGGLAGSTGRVELSPDGKTVNLIATKDGKDSPPLSFQNNAAGQAQLMQRFMKADDATQLAFLKDAADREAAQGKAALDERRVAAIEQRADTDSRKLDGMMAGLIGGRRSGGSGDGSGGASGNGPALKDRRDYLSDFSQGLEDPKTAMSPGESTGIQQRNQIKLVQADAIFSTNAEFGNVLTAPQARAAMDLAQDPKNIRKVKDNNTGAVYEVVNVNGKQVVVGTGALKSKNTNEEQVDVVNKNPMQELFRMDEKKLMAMAKRPKGVSFAESEEAQAELDKRKSGPRTLKAW